MGSNKTTIYLHDSNIMDMIEGTVNIHNKVNLAYNYLYYFIT